MIVSVVIPAFNYARFIGDTIDSLRAQTLTDWECIVVDDGSTDETVAVVSKLSARDPRIQLIRQPNCGQAAARNAGLRAASGRFVQLLDADDLIESDKFRRQAEFLDHHADVDIVYSDARFFPSDRPHERRMCLAEPDRPWMPRVSGQGNEVLIILVAKNIMVVNSPLVRREVFNEVGGFDESLPRADDWDMWIRCALAGKRFKYLDEPHTYALVRCHQTSLTRRDRRLLASSLAIHHKLAAASIETEVRAVNDRELRWIAHVHELALRIDVHVPAHGLIVLVDDDKMRADLLGYRTIPFTERDGQYWGPPVTGEHAVAELERLRCAGAEFIIFGRPGMWYLDHYSSLREYLDSRYCRLWSDDVAVIYDLRSSAGLMANSQS